MATLDKEIKVIAVKGQRGYSSYEEAVANDYFSGTLEEWIATYATPENYVTRDEFKKVTQAEYDALEQAGELIPNCYYIITDDTTYDELINRIEALESDVTDNTSDITDIQDDITNIKGDITDIETAIAGLENKKLYQHNIYLYGYLDNAQPSFTITMQITNNSAEQINSFFKLYMFLNQKGFVSANNRHLATGHIQKLENSSYKNYPIDRGVFYDSSTGHIHGSYIENTTITGFEFSSISTIEDTVVELM